MPIHIRDITRQQGSNSVVDLDQIEPGNEVEHALDSLVRWLNLVKIDDFVRAGLHQELIRVINRIDEIGNAIYRTYFDVRVESPKDCGSTPSPAEAEPDRAPATAAMPPS